MIGIVITEKRRSFNISFSGVDGKAREFEPAFCRTFFLPFQISYRIGKAFIFNKNEGNENVGNKVSGSGY